VAAAQSVLVECGALEEMERIIARLSEEAVAALSRIDLAGESRRELEALAAYVTQRRV